MRGPGKGRFYYRYSYTCNYCIVTLRYRCVYLFLSGIIESFVSLTLLLCFVIVSLYVHVLGKEGVTAHMMIKP